MKTQNKFVRLSECRQVGTLTIDCPPPMVRQTRHERPFGSVLSNGLFGFIQRAILLVTAIVLVAACGSEAKEDALPAGSQILALGDSLTAGAGVASEEAWPDLLANRTGWVVINGGISGDTSKRCLAPLAGAS